jgi:hypothetical protein
VVGGQRDAKRGVQRGGALVRASSKIEDKLTRGDGRRHLPGVPIGRQDAQRVSEGL